MLSARDQEVVRRDPDVPGLGVLLDEDALLEVLRREIRVPGVDSVRVTYLRYKPGTNCLAALRLCRAGDWTPGYIRTLGKGSGRVAASAAEGGEGTTNGSMRLRSMAAELHLFPSDRRLPALDRVTDPQWVARRLSVSRSDEERLESATAELLAYKPERRCTVKWTATDSTSVVAKTYLPGDVAKARRHAQVAARFQGVGGVLSKSACERRDTVIVPWIPGRSLVDMMRDGVVSAACFENIGRTLARWHYSEGDRTLTAGLGVEGAEVVGRWIRPLAFLMPELGERLGAVGEALLSWGVGVGMMRPVHGDFHPGQILETAGGVHFLDFDEAHLGNPSEDLGAFVAGLEREVVTGRLDRVVSERYRKAFLGGYQRGTGRAAPSDLVWFVAVRLLGEAVSFFRQRHEDWAGCAERVLTRIEELLDVGGPKGATARRSRSVGEPVAADPGLPALAWALDPERVRVEALPSVWEALRDSAWELDTVELNRHKPGRRAVVVYRLRRAGDASGTMKLYGKIRRRGVDVRNLALLRALRRGGFGGTTVDGISIPTPVSAVEDWGMVLFEGVPGTPVSERLEREPCTGAVEFGRRVADALLKLHRSELVSERRHTMADEWAELEKRLSRVAETSPGIARRVFRVLEGCRRLSERLPVARNVLLHRDFHPEQVLLDGDRVWLLDLDLAAMGDPALDAGNFSAHLLELGLRRKGSERAFGPVEEAFRVRYLTRSLVTPEAMDAWTTLSLARHIAISRQIDGRQSATEAILDCCERRLNAGGDV